MLNEMMLGAWRVWRRLQTQLLHLLGQLTSWSESNMGGVQSSSVQGGRTEAMGMSAGMRAVRTVRS